MKNIMFKLKNILTYDDKKYLVKLLFFSIFISIVEVVGVSAIMPFLSVAIDFTTIHSNIYYSYIYKLLNFSNDLNFIILFGIVLVIFYIFRSAVNLYYSYLLSSFAHGRYHTLACRLFDKYLGFSYKDFIKKNSSELTKTIINEAANLTSLLSSTLFLFSELLVVFFIYLMLLMVDYKITIVLTIFLTLNGFIMMKYISSRIKKEGIKRAEYQKIFYEVLNKSLSNFKLIKLQSNSELLTKEFSNTSFAASRVNIKAQLLSYIPKYFLEALSFSTIIIIILYLLVKYENDISAVLATLSMFVLALYRLMPSINRIMASYNSIMFHSKALDIVHKDLMYEDENLGNEKVIINNAISLRNITFEYEKNKNIIENLSIEIHKGEKVAFIGESGSGKSTLVDIIIGLYKPKSGKIIIDDIIINDTNIKSWRKQIGYIPQSVYLFDGTVGENVSYGSDYEKEKVDYCLKRAKIYDFLQTKKGQDTYVGEGGVMLSGGQKQRIAIARALYLEPEVLVLDEATSALDSNTEKEIMDEIYNISSDKTLIIIAHRLSTIDKCDTVYTLSNGIIIEKNYK